MSTIEILNDGRAKIPFNGHYFSLDLVIIRVSENESAPVDYIAYRNLSFNPYSIIREETGHE